MYTFADLFSWIWWFHMALHNLWLRCVMACDFNVKARETYELNFKDKSPDIFQKWLFFKDINDVDEKSLSDFDIICWWFPCQPFSQAWFKRWFQDKRGNLFFEIARLIKHKRPKAFFLENVRHLEKHDDGKTLEVIIDVLTNQLWYTFYYKIIKASDYWLPQNRPRIYMVWFDKSRLKADAPNFVFPEKRALKYTMSDVFWWHCERKIWFTLRLWWKGSAITDRRNRDWYMIDWQERRLTPREWKKMQGFPDDFNFPVSDNEAMKQLWNSVAIDAIQYTAKEIITYMDKHFN